MSKKRAEKYNLPSKILIVNVHSSENAGDYALLLQTITYLQSAFGAVEIKILANWPNESTLMESGFEIIASPWWIIKVWDKAKQPRYQVLSFLMSFIYLLIFKVDVLKALHRVIPQDWLRLFKAYLETDLVVAVSGNQLFSSGRYAWPLPVMGFPIYLGLSFRKKVLVFPQSVGPLNTKFEERIVRYLYDRVDKLFIRDNNSLELVAAMNIRKSKPSFMYDLAFAYPPETAVIAREIMEDFAYKASCQNVGMTVISSMPSYLSETVINNYYLSMAKTISALLADGDFEVFLFCQVHGPSEDEDDHSGIEKVVSHLPPDSKDRLHIVNRKLAPSILKACYGLMDIFIASRLHSGIFSLGMRVPTLFIGYLHKTIGVLKSIAMEAFFIDLLEVSYEELINKFNSMWLSKFELKEITNNKLLVIEKALENFPSEIIEALNDRKN